MLFENAPTSMLIIIVELVFGSLLSIGKQYLDKRKLYNSQCSQHGFDPVQILSNLAPEPNLNSASVISGRAGPRGVNKSGGVTKIFVGVYVCKWNETFLRILRAVVFALYVNCPYQIFKVAFLSKSPFGCCLTKLRGLLTSSRDPTSLSNCLSSKTHSFGQELKEITGFESLII